LTLKVGGNFIDIGPDGVTIQGTMVLINSGGSPGSGSGSHPADPDPPREAKPSAPALADDSKSGQKSALSL
jgi:type VI secretion system secreted protein VgrG